MSIQNREIQKEFNEFNKLNKFNIRLNLFNIKDSVKEFNLTNLVLNYANDKKPIAKGEVPKNYFEWRES